MKIYVGGPTGQRRKMIIEKHKDIGACLNRDNYTEATARVMSWFFDNGAFSDACNERNFNYKKFLNRLWNIEASIRFTKLPVPDFVVLPDKVYDSNSMQYSLAWLDYLNDILPYFDYYIAIQDGMSLELIEEYIKKRSFDGLFLGGTKKFKYKEGYKWVELAKKYNLPIHCGGVGSRKAILWAKMTGFDSCDSALCMIHPRHLKDVLEIKNELLWAS